MIQFKRGTTASWRNTKTKLASGQPGYDKEKHKIKVGDGVSSWADLPYASGLFAYEILDSEEAAKSRKENNSEDLTLITYGAEPPSEETTGQIYLQLSESESEIDYVVNSGVSGIWTYQLWKSGIARCWGTLSVTTKIQTNFSGSQLYHNNDIIESADYPFTFDNIPSETVSVQGPDGSIIWLANSSKNTQTHSGNYYIASPVRQNTDAEYLISLQVEGWVSQSNNSR